MPSDSKFIQQVVKSKQLINLLFFTFSVADDGKIRRLNLTHLGVAREEFVNNQQHLGLPAAYKIR